MKKILLILFLFIIIGKVKAVGVQITKVTASVTTSYSGNRKDTIITNNARITTNLLPIGNFNFYFRWADLDDILPAYDERVMFNIMVRDFVTGNFTKVASMVHYISSTDQDDSTSMPLLLSLPIDIVGKEYEYIIRITYIQNRQEIEIASSNIWRCSFIDDPNKIYYNAICCSKVVTLPYQPID